MKKSQINAIIHETTENSIDDVYKNANTHQVTPLSKDSYAYPKYIKPIKDREKTIKTQKVINWLISNIFSLLSLIIAILSLFVSIIALQRNLILQQIN